MGALPLVVKVWLCKCRVHAELGEYAIYRSVTAGSAAYFPILTSRLFPLFSATLFFAWEPLAEREGNGGGGGGRGREGGGGEDSEKAELEWILWLNLKKGDGDSVLLAAGWRPLSLSLPPFLLFSPLSLPLIGCERKAYRLQVPYSLLFTLFLFLPFWRNLALPSPTEAWPCAVSRF